MLHRYALPGAVLLLSACSSSPGSTGPDAQADAPVSPDAGAGSEAAADGPPVCSALANVAAAVTIEQVASDPPAQTGGAIAPGTYALTSAVIYTGPAGPAGTTGTAQTTLRIGAGTFEVASAGAPPTRRLTFVAVADTLTTTETCPGSTVTHASYTATPTTLVAELAAGTDDAGARTLVQTYTRQ